MGLIRDNISRQFLAIPDDKKGQIVYKWPDINIRRWSSVIVEPDYVALFVSRGEVVATLPPGKHSVDANEIPVLGNLIDRETGGNAYRAELYFASTREHPSLRFGGRLDEVQDPVTTLVVTLRAFGEYSLKVSNPANLVVNLTGTVDVSNNDAITAWVNEQLFKVLRTATTTHLVTGEWPILGLSVHLPEIEAAALADAGAQLETYGLVIARLGNVDINISDEDNAALKKLVSDVAYTRLAGSFGEAAKAQALQGAGQGMSEGGAAVSPMFLGAGLGMAGTMMGPGQEAPAPPATGFPGGSGGFAQPGAAPAAPAPGPAPAEAAPVDAAPAPAGVDCSQCSAGLRPGAKFCDECGTPVPQVAVCSNCSAELRPGAKFCDSCGTATGA